MTTAEKYDILFLTSGRTASFPRRFLANVMKYNEMREKKMKRERYYIGAILVLLCVCTALLVSSLTANAALQKLNKYDVNADGAANIGDVSDMLNYLANGCEHRPVTVGRVEPTCSSCGTMPYEACELCEEVLGEVIYIEKLPHTPETIGAVAPTCTKTGLSAGSRCAVCGEILAAQEVLPAAGHTPTEIPAVAPTCTETGLSAGSRCAVCGEILTAQESVPALGHNYENMVCTRCGETEPLYKGKVVTLGRYEQDNDLTNGAEAIEWIVLDIRDGRALLLSKYALDCCVYDPHYPSNVTWAECALEDWLNDDFYNAAFDAGEQAKIADTKVITADNPVHHTIGGAEVTDKVFLLSMEDVTNEDFGFINSYNADSARWCLPTAYAIARGCNCLWSPNDANHGCCWWWLRTPGNYNRSVSGVDSGGGVDPTGYAIDDDGNGVRPAMWIIL